MSGTAPSDPAPGGRPEDRGVAQTSLDANQHGQAQNILDETKDTYGSTADRNIGEAIDAGKAKAGLSSRVDELLNQPLMGDGASGAGRKAEAVSNQGFKVGESADMHDLAKSKQP